MEWHHDLIDRLFKFLLRTACGLSEAEARGYSVHSFRIYLACALYAAGCPNDRIQAILRWKSEDALLIYAVRAAERCRALLVGRQGAGGHSGLQGGCISPHRRRGGSCSFPSRGWQRHRA